MNVDGEMYYVCQCWRSLKVGAMLKDREMGVVDGMVYWLFWGASVCFKGGKMCVIVSLSIGCG